MMNGTTFCVHSTLSLSAPNAALKSDLKNCCDVVVKRPQEGDYDERVVRQIETGEKFGVEEPCRAINNAIFDGTFKLGNIRI